MRAVIHPLGDRLKVLPLVPAEATSGGIVMPETTEARDRPLEGLVLAVGRGADDVRGVTLPLECEVGDIVVFGRYAGIYIHDRVIEQDVLLMREDEALGRIFRLDVELVRHETCDFEHVPGDPRCLQCRAGVRVEVLR
jgi:chaperonin GroES